MKIKIHPPEKLIVCEMALISLLWFISLIVTTPLFIFSDRPMSGRFEGIAAHTLVSLKAFEEWGFWKVLGASLLFPKTYEFSDIDITSLTKPEVYLSYPSLWLYLPYIILKLLNALDLNVIVSPQYLQFYSLVINRLICGIVVYYLLSEITKIYAEKSLTDTQKRSVAFLGLVGWMFTPPVLYWTQNVYFTDQAVLLPIYITSWISLKCIFKFETLSRRLKFLLFVASLGACGFDWYGWVAVAVIISLSLVEKLREKGNKSLFSITFLKQYLKSVKFIIWGTLIAAFTFIGQLLYYKNGIIQLVATYNLRLSSGDDTGNEITLKDFAVRIFQHWIPYFPKAFQKFLCDYTLSFKDIAKSNLSMQFVTGAFISLLLISLYLLYKLSENRRIALYAYILVLGVPLLQIFILKQHSYMHDFSSFKMGLPIVFSLLLVPVLLLSKLLKINDFNWKLRVVNTLIPLAVGSLCIAIIISSRSGAIDYASIGGHKAHGQDVAFLVSKNFAADDLLIADSPELIVGAYPPDRLWYTKRFIYAPEQVKNLQRRVTLEKLKSMKPIFLTFKDTASKSIVNSICQNQWIDLQQNVGGRIVVACSEAKISRLLEQ
ncbi:hypothetical protein [Microseira sp. BLCC-F43]|jgi:hypothetical protein|uniref:hypothetical protein n=1 Tax=Microseira sp. BLCC-F43 TaxID=3153602 RepID=UPI0035B8B450